MKLVGNIHFSQYHKYRIAVLLRSCSASVLCNRDLMFSGWVVFGFRVLGMCLLPFHKKNLPLRNLNILVIDRTAKATSLSFDNAMGSKRASAHGGAI